MTPAELGAETWLAIIGGARGVGFFTHTFSPKDNPLDLSPAIRAAIVRTTTAMHALAPGLTGNTVDSSANSPAIAILARRSRHATYVFTVNMNQTPVKAQLTIPSLRNGGAGVFGDPRNVLVENGKFSDNFQPLGIHIYVQRD